ncbi:plastin-3-like [Arapaima gigas]
MMAGKISKDEMEELREAFAKVGKWLGGLCSPTSMEGSAAPEVLSTPHVEANLPLPGYKVREIIEKLMAEGDRNKDNKISFDEFVSVSSTVRYTSHTQPQRSRTFLL